MRKFSRYVEKKLVQIRAISWTKKRKNSCDTWNRHKTKIPQRLSVLRDVFSEQELYTVIFFRFLPYSLCMANMVYFCASIS